MCENWEGPAVDKFEVANALRETGLLMTVSGTNAFKARAYLRGASSIESISEDLDTVIKENRLTDIPGIGPGLAANISEFYKTGEMKVLNSLRKELPAGVIELSEVPGLTLPKIETLNQQLQINTVEDLERACVNHQVQKVKGFGAKTEAKILDGIAASRNTKKKMLLVHAMQSAEMLAKHLRTSCKSFVEVAGEIRRWHEVIDYIKIHVESENSERVFSALGKYPLTTQVLECTDRYCKVKLTESVVAEVYCANNSSTALIKNTGSNKHWQQLKELAKSKGMELSEDGLRANDKLIKCKSESDMYAALGLANIPAELREGMDEIEIAKDSHFAELIRLEHIRGMTHCHTTFSDGTNTVLEMARAAEQMGMSYLTITDHSPTAHYAGGLEIDRLKRQWEEIDKAQEKVKIRLLKGTESDILADGALDYPDSILEKFDIIIASVHNRYRLNHEQMTKRVIQCIKNPLFKIWGHPLGRLVLRRPPIDCDVDKILDTIAESNAAIEINGDPYRLDLAPDLVRAARHRGIKFVISTDAHATRDYRNLRFGIHMGRRAGLLKREVLNTMSFKEFAEFVKPA